MEDALARLARLNGIEPGYHDIWGEWRATPDETRRRILEALGVDAHDDATAQAALAAHERGRWERVVAPMSVVRHSALERGIRLQLADAALGRALSLRITEESGDVREERIEPLALERIEEFLQEGWQASAFRLPLPADLPEGYHRIAILAGSSLLGEGLLAVAPERDA